MPTGLVNIISNIRHCHFERRAKNIVKNAQNFRAGHFPGGSVNFQGVPYPLAKPVDKARLASEGLAVRMVHELRETLRSGRRKRVRQRVVILLGDDSICLHRRASDGMSAAVDRHCRRRISADKRCGRVFREPPANDFAVFGFCCASTQRAASAASIPIASLFILISFRISLIGLYSSGLGLSRHKSFATVFW